MCSTWCRLAWRHFRALRLAMPPLQGQQQRPRQQQPPPSKPELLRPLPNRLALPTVCPWLWQLRQPNSRLSQ
ncbi:uncharacterized protein DMAD_05679 [Drosophila madeirensis]|uniref:Uncharacterized protein n=1 Tax=Drosophila madeirensis TaxID=30013 RepID=A0AAU9FPD2_DROMD